MASSCKRLLFFLLFFVSCVTTSYADWINLSGAENSRNIAEIYVLEDHVKIKLEIFVQDLLIFEELLPDTLFPKPIPGRPGIEERLNHFAQKTFQIITDTGQKLPARLDLAEPRMRVNRPSPLAGAINPYTRQRIPGPPEDKRVLYVELTYPFNELPNSLTFIPPGDKNGFPKASIGFICYHQEVPVVDFRQLTDKNILHLEWDDPWYSAFEKKQLKRNLQTGVRTYLYIEPYEVRHEILVRVKDMMTWMEFDLRGNEFIEVDEFKPVRQQVAQFFMDREKVLIDGKQLKPILDKTAYVESSMLRSRFIEIPERVPLNTAMIGIVITYLTDGIPQEVITQWDLFSDRVQKVTARMTDPVGPFPYDLSPDDNVLKWTNYLKKYSIPTVENIVVDAAHQGVPVPLLSLACTSLILPFGFATFKRRQHSQPVKMHIGTMVVLVIAAIAFFPHLNISIGSSARASQMSEEESKAITHSLLKNIYRAFDFRDEEDVYDKLAISVNGDLLQDVYLQSRKSLVIEQAGGAQAKVEQVDIHKVKVTGYNTELDNLEIRTKWSATGAVGHWGHVHIRQNYYDAILSLKIDEGSWKIAEIELLEEKRVDPFAQLQSVRQ